MPVAKGQIRQIISENNLNSVTDVYALLRDSFKDILQELMEAEMDATLGYEKNRKGVLQTDNKRNGHSPKNLKSQYGEFQIDVPRDRNGEFEPKLIPKYQRDISGIEEKVISLYARGMGTRDIHDQLNGLHNRGVKDVLSSCVDGLLGFKGAIQAVFPKAGIQRCVIHMLRNPSKYISYKGPKKFASDFKADYNAPSEAAALAELESVEGTWGKKYPYAISNWEGNWEDVSSPFQFPDDIRRVMYTTDIIGGLNRQYRKATKTKSVFPSDTSLEKMLFLASQNVTKKWTQRYRNWDQVLNQLTVLYGERLTEYL